MLEKLFAEIDELHFPEYYVDSSEIDKFELQLGKELPEDLKRFYRRYKSVKLFGCINRSISHSLTGRYRTV